MSKAHLHTSRNLLDVAPPTELVLLIDSFAGGVNTIGEDQAVKANEARVIKNWDALSLGGMIRSKGINEIADGGVSYSAAPDLLAYHKEGASDEVYGIIAGDLVKVNGASLSQEDASAFTTAVLSHAVSAGGKLWITNQTDGLKFKKIGQSIATPPGSPSQNYARIYHHKSRLIQEGGVTDKNRVAGSRAGQGNWVNASVGAAVFTGGGLNDLTSGGTYTGEKKDVYEVEIDATGTPDTYKWRKNGGAYTSGVSITVSPQTLSDGVTVTFGATTGHTLGNKWTITITGNAWSASNDAFTIDFPNDTKGIATAFPSGDEDLVFTEFGCFSLFNFPNVAYRPIANGRGCSAPSSIAKGDEGVFFASKYPTLGIFLFDGVNFIELTQFNKDVLIEKVDFAKRCFGVYRDKKYYFIYNELGSGVSYPNKCWVYDTRFGRWHERELNEDLADSLGYPALLTELNNEIYVASSRKDKVYEIETGEEDEGNATEATYRTKDFSSIDFLTAGGKQFPIDNARLKLKKVTVEYYGTTGTLGLGWAADSGRISGGKVFDLSAEGDLLNSTFIINTSKLVSLPPDKVVTQSFPNKAVGRKFYFEITNSGTSNRPKVKKIKIHAIVMEEN